MIQRGPRLHWPLAWPFVLLLALILIALIGALELGALSYAYQKLGLEVGGSAVPATAYVAGVIGCLLGADILNLGRIRNLGAPLASIGRAGTFDAIFLTGIMAVLIASV